MLAATTTPPITRLKDIRGYLNDGFVLLFGSAVSGQMTPALPMVQNFTNTLLGQAILLLETGSWPQRMAAQYTRELLSGCHRGLLERTKFEDFLWRLERTMGHEQINTLLADVYGCKDNQYNGNHEAIAFLLKSRHCIAAVTTNFDNAVELVFQDLTVRTDVDQYELPEASQPPVLYKLHGDALSSSCVRNSPDLARAGVLGTHQKLEDILRDKALLVVGYSGFGDIDIAPHIGKTERHLLWGHFRNADKRLRDHQIDFLCDLSDRKPSDEKENISNILIDLASSFGWTGPSSLTREVAWKEAMREWVHQKGQQKWYTFISTFVCWRLRWPYVQLAYYHYLKKASRETTLDYALATSQVSAFYSSGKIINSLKSSNLTNSEAIQIEKLVGFNHWRKGKITRAMATLGDAISAVKPVTGNWVDVDPIYKGHIADIARHYLEAVIELVYRYSDDRQRHQLVHKTKAREIVDILKLFEYESFSLNRIAILEVEYWLGKKVTSDQVLQFALDCIETDEWESAALATQFLLTLSIPQANQVIPKLVEGLKDRQATKILWSISRKIDYERFKRRIPLHIINGRFLMPVFIIGIEMMLAVKRLRWKKDFAQDRVRVERGFN